MFALTIDTEWFTNLDTTTWLILGGVAALWGTKLIPSGALDKLKSFLPSFNRADGNETVQELIDKLQRKRAELVAELAKIDAVMGVPKVE